MTDESVRFGGSERLRAARRLLHPKARRSQRVGVEAQRGGIVFHEQDRGKLWGPLCALRFTPACRACATSRAATERSVPYAQRMPRAFRARRSGDALPVCGLLRNESVGHSCTAL